MQEATVVSKWGNSKGIRVPVEILRKAQVDLNDKLEYLFKDYDGGRFKTELVDLGEPKGNEKW